MYRIINDTLFARHPTPYAHDLKILDLGGGQIESSVLPRYGWSEACALSPLARLDYAEALRTVHDGLTPLEVAEKAAEHRERATRRARTQVRRLAKAKGLTTLLTLTYRENMLDRDRMARDLDVFLKRVRRLIPGFQYIAVFERQKRGAWHAHLACEAVQPHYRAGGKRVRSYDLLRSMWRAVVGLDNGNVDVSRNRKLSSAAKLAAYLSKYIGKTFDQALKHVNAYSASGRALPRAITIRSMHTNLLDAVGELYALMATEVSVSEHYGDFCDGGGWFMCLSPPERRRCKSE